MTAFTTGSARPAPGVSIFLPTAARHASGHLQRAIDSALAQDYVDWELFAVDDGSRDGTGDYLAACARADARIHHVRLDTNVGLPAFTLSRAWTASRAPRIAWLFDDCEYLPGHLSTLVQALDDAPAAGLAYGRVRAELGGGTNFVIGAPYDAVRAATGHNDIPNVAVMMRRIVIETVGWYDPHVLLKRLCDWDLWQRVAQRFPLAFVDRVLAVERGTSLAQSLGRTSTLDMDLVHAYVAGDRNARLAPATLDAGSCYRVDLGFALTPRQSRNLDLLLFEHALQTRNEGLALSTAQHLATEAQDGEGPAWLHAAGMLLSARTTSRAEGEIRLERDLRAALAAADARTAEIERLGGALAAHAASDADQAAAFAVLQAALASERGATENMRREAQAAAESAQVFRRAADERLARLQDVEAAYATAEAAAQTYRTAADERLEQLAAVQQQVDHGAALLVALQQKLEVAEAAARAGAAREASLEAVAAAKADQLTAAQFRIDEAAQVERTWLGRLAFTLQRLLAR